MNPDDIDIGDELFVRAGFNHTKSARIAVRITDKQKGSAEGGYIFFTDPPVGSGFGICAGWLEK